MEEYLLSKNDFGSSMRKTYENLLGDTDFADVTLACENDKWVKAHKLILSGSSSFFRHLLLVNPHKHPLVYLKGVNIRDLEAVLQFIYLGETKVEKDKVTSFLETAKELQVDGLMKETEEVTYADNKQAEDDDFTTPSFDTDLARTCNKQTAIDSQSYINDVCKVCGFKTRAQNEYHRAMIMKRHIEKVHYKENATQFVKVESSGNDYTQHSAIIEEVEDTDTQLTRDQHTGDFTSGNEGMRPELSKTYLDEKIAENNINIIPEEKPQKEQENTFACNKCQFKTKHQFAMKRHVSGVHDKVRAYECEFCGKKCAQKFHLLKHIEIAHQNNLNTTL